MDNYFRKDFQPNATFEQGEYNPPPDVPPLVRSKESGDKIYFVENGTKHWVTSPEVLRELGFDFGQDVMIDKEIMRQLRPGDPVKMENVGQFPKPPLSDPAFSEGEIVIPAHEEPTVDHPQIPGLTSIIIPAFWNSYQMFHLTGDCIGSIREHTDKSKTPYEIILVINGKTGIGFNEEEYKNTYADKIIFNEKNEGYTKAINQGVRVSQGEYTCLMSNDVKVFDHWLEDLIEGLSGLDLIMTTPMYGMPFARAVEAKQLREQADPLAFSDFQDGSCLLTRKEVFDKLGLLDEQFFLYCADVDFFRRMKDAGMTIASTKRVNTNHLISATDVDNKSEVMNEDKAKFKAKWPDSQ